MEIGFQHITIGGGVLTAAAWSLVRSLRQRERGDPDVQVSASIAQGVRLLDAGMLEIKAAVAGLPSMKDQIDLQGIDIRKLKGDVHRIDGDLSDLRRENEDREDRLRRLERGR